MARSTVHSLCFPESFSRTSPLQESDPRAAMPLSEIPIRSSRSSVMKLENILNDVSIECDPPYHSRNLCVSPERSDQSDHVHSVTHTGSVVKKKKVKMHKCPECQKEFPRPSGLKTHMNMHTKEKPFACTFPGCSRTFSVVSNAKRHMRTHGVGLPSEDQLSESPCPVPYIVGFEAPVVICSPEVDLLKEPLKLRWVPAAGLFGSLSSSSGGGSSSLSSSSLSSSPTTSGTASTSESSSAASSRARSLSGAGGAGDRHGSGPRDVDAAMISGDVVVAGGVSAAAAAAATSSRLDGRRRAASNGGIHLFRSTSVDWETTPERTSSWSWSESPTSGPPSPADSCGESSDAVMQTNEDDDDDFFTSFRNHRRVESERSTSWRVPVSKR